MLALIVEFRVRPEYVAAFAAAILKNAGTSRRTEPGCIRFDVCLDPADGCTFILYEIYDSDAAFEAHKQTSHYLAMNQITASWIEQKRVRRLERLGV